VTWDGVDLGAVPPHERRFGLMFQEYALFPHRDVAGNVEFGLRMGHVDARDRARRVDEVLDLVGLRDLRDRRVAQLSGGEQQRVALARALAVEPRLLMLDEPLGALDQVWRVRLLDEMRALFDRAQLPAVYVTHDHDEAFAIASRVAVMRDGRIVQVGTPVDVWRRPADPWTAAFLGFGEPIVGELRARLASTPASDVVLRPDALHIDSHGDIEGIVRRTRFAGGRVAVTVQCDENELVAYAELTNAPNPGDRICLRVERDAVLEYPRD
jgi:thiamine transport system ATP-binding protein